MVIPGALFFAPIVADGYSMLGPNTLTHKDDQRLYSI